MVERPTTRLQIRARAEAAAPAGDDHRPHVVVAIGPIERVDQLDEHRSVNALSTSGRSKVIVSAWSATSQRMLSKSMRPPSVAGRRYPGVRRDTSMPPPTAPPRVGFLGLGIMGSRMAARVRGAGHPLTVWTHTPGKAARWAAEYDARAVDTPAEVAQASDVVVDVVVDGAQVASVLIGEQGVADAAHEGLLCVDMSTIAPTDTRRIAAALAQRGMRMLDAPVTGSAPRAQEGTLTIMVGGEEADFARARPLLQTMGRLVVYVGELGQGEALKLINNAVGAANAAALAEALLLARAAGLDFNAFEQVLGSGSGASAQLQLKAGAMRPRLHPALQGQHLLKDVRLCLAEAQAAGVRLPAAAHAGELLAATVDAGHGAEDYAALIEAAERVAGRRL